MGYRDVLNMIYRSREYIPVRSTYILQLHRDLLEFTSAGVVAHCPSIGRSSVLASLKKLTEEGLVERYGSGRRAYYVRGECK